MMRFLWVPLLALVSASEITVGTQEEEEAWADANCAYYSFGAETYAMAAEVSPFCACTHEERASRPYLSHACRRDHCAAVGASDTDFSQPSERVLMLKNLISSLMIAVFRGDDLVEIIVSAEDSGLPRVPLLSPARLSHRTPEFGSRDVE